MTRVLLISGSTRAASTNTALLRTAALAPNTILYGGLASLPHFNPDDDRDPLPAAVASLRCAIDGAEAVLICTPEYAGTLPGSFKNLLDWTVGGTSFTGKRTAWVNAAADAQRGSGAHATLATVLSYVQASVIEPACRSIPIARESVDADGLIADPAIQAAIAEVIALLVAG